MAQDLFTGAAGTLVSHDSGWNLADTADGETLTDIRIDGSGFAVQNNSFGQTRVYYAGTTVAAKSEIVVPVGAFATLPSSEAVVVFIAGGAGNKGIEARIGAAQLTGQTVNSVRIASNGAFVVQQSLSPTIDTSSVALTISLLRTSTTNVDLVVNGTTYPINTTGVDITSGESGFQLIRNSGSATTLKIDSWTDGVSSGGSSTINPGTAALSMNGLAGSMNPFTNVFIREVLINEAGSPVTNKTGISLLVWYGGSPNGSPNLSYSALTTDANGTASWSIVPGTLVYNQMIFYVATDGSASLSMYTCARMTPTYN